MATRDEIIAQELATDPLGRNYAGLSDDAARDDMNDNYRTLEQGVWLSDLYQYLLHEVHNPRAGTPPASRPDACLRMLAELATDGTIQRESTTDPTNSGTPRTITLQDQLAAEHLFGFITKATDAGGQFIFCDFSRGVISQTWDVMVDVGVIGQTERDAIETLSDIPQSRAAELTVPNVTSEEIRRNRP